MSISDVLGLILHRRIENAERCFFAAACVNQRSCFLLNECLKIKDKNLIRNFYSKHFGSDNGGKARCLKKVLLLLAIVLLLEHAFEPTNLS